MLLLLWNSSLELIVPFSKKPNVVVARVSLYDGHDPVCCFNAQKSATSAYCQEIVEIAVEKM